MLEELKELISEIIDIPKEKLDLSSGPSNLPEWDSLAQLCIVNAIEEKYKIKLSMNQIISIKSINHIKKLIEKNND